MLGAYYDLHSVIWECVAVCGASLDRNQRRVVALVALDL
jgi:hypothetical protein